MQARLRLALIGIITVGVVGSAVLVEPTPTTPKRVAKSSGRLLGAQTFNGPEFKRLFNNLALPSLTPIIDSPFITGHDGLDAGIQRLAASRGYRLWAVPSGNLEPIDGVELQLPAAVSWRRLKAAAAKENVALKIEYGYRSVDEQRALFLGTLRQLGNDLGSAGSVLKRVAPPGYSRHHTGYVVDLSDASQPFTPFLKTKGYNWLAANNFANAKRFGFIPSYPEGAASQGPEPEPWEFAWVGVAVLTE